MADDDKCSCISCNQNCQTQKVKCRGPCNPVKEVNSSTMSMTSAKSDASACTECICEDLETDAEDTAQMDCYCGPSPECSPCGKKMNAEPKQCKCVPNKKSVSQKNSRNAKFCSSKNEPQTSDDENDTVRCAFLMPDEAEQGGRSCHCLNPQSSGTNLSKKSEGSSRSNIAGAGRACYCTPKKSSQPKRQVCCSSKNDKASSKPCPNLQPKTKQCFCGVATSKPDSAKKKVPPCCRCEEKKDRKRNL